MLFLPIEHQLDRELRLFRQRGADDARGELVVDRVAHAVDEAREAGIEQMIGDFRTTVTAVIAAVTDNVSRMETTARTIAVDDVLIEAGLKAGSDSSDVVTAPNGTATGNNAAA